jgi:Urocanase Rossmann-like domain
LENAKRDVIAFVQQAERVYAGLMRRYGADRDPSSDEEPNLGGKLLYAGELSAESRALVVAGNVAGAATLTATGEPQTQKQAIRDGVVDFLVTSLDEALRILKNEIRKRERVAVCVSVTPALVEREMQERGVQLDLLWSMVQGDAGSEAQSAATLLWSVETAPARWLPKLDALALLCLDPAQLVERRWARNAPRHLGRMAHGVQVEHGEIGTAVTVGRVESDRVEEQRFTLR